MDNGNTTFGLRPPGYQGPEVIEQYYWDTIAYAVSAAPTTNVILFQQGTYNGNPQYRNFSLPPTINRKVAVVGMKVEAAIGFTPGTGATVGSVQNYFQKYGYLQWNIESRQNAYYRLVDLMATDNYVFGITQADREKQSDFLIMQNPIELPSQGECSLTYVPAPSLPNTSATASINLPGLGYTNDVGHAITVTLYTLLARPS